SRTRIKPPSEVTRDPWKSTLRMKQAGTTCFVFHPSGVCPPRRVPHVETLMNKGVGKHQEVRPVVAKTEIRSNAERGLESLPIVLQPVIVRVLARTGILDRVEKIGPA